MNFINTKLRVKVSYSNSDMDGFHDGVKIDFIVEVPIKKIINKSEMKEKVENLCSEMTRNLLIANDINFREYMIKIESITGEEL